MILITWIVRKYHIMSSIDECVCHISRAYHIMSSIDECVCDISEEIIDRLTEARTVHENLVGLSRVDACKN